MSSLLLTTLFLPLAGAALIWATAEHGRDAARRMAAVISTATLVLAIVLVAGYRHGADAGGDYAVTDAAWLGSESGVNIRFSVGLDGLGLWLFGLSAVLVFTSVLVSWEAIQDRAAEFYSLVLILETGMLGVFAARDIILFYVFFEFTLIPLFLLIGVWGSEERRYAAMKFFLFTLAGSVLTFLGLLAVVIWDWRHSDTGVMTFSIPELTRRLVEQPMDSGVQLWVFLALFAGFAIKVPLFPLHTWLPLAHVQAPTAGSVLLAGVLLKIGGYGFVRFSLPMLPDATATLMPYVLWLSVAGIIYGALVALAQRDIKRLIAYSSVSHLGFCLLGLFALNRLGMQGGVLQMINHGLSTGGLFAVVGMIYERYHTRQISDLGGLARRMPKLACFMLLLTFSSIGLPGLNGFAGELPLLVGAFQRGWVDPSHVSPELAQWQWHLRAISVLAVAGVVLGAWYMLWLVQRVFFGPLKEEGHSIRDLSPREVLALFPLAVLILWIGIFPQTFLQPISKSLNPVSDRLEHAFEQRYGQANERTVETTPNPMNEVVTGSSSLSQREVKITAAEKRNP